MTKQTEIETRTIRILYRNWKGETRWRTVWPQKLSFGKTVWHPESQWFLEAVDIDKEELRLFALRDILGFMDYPETEIEQ